MNAFWNWERVDVGVEQKATMKDKQKFAMKANGQREGNKVAFNALMISENYFCHLQLVSKWCEIFSEKSNPKRINLEEVKKVIE